MGCDRLVATLSFVNTRMFNMGYHPWPEAASRQYEIWVESAVCNVKFTKKMIARA